MALGDYGRRVGFRNLGRLDLEERRWRQQQLARNQLARQEAELAQRMAQEEEAISLSQWQPEPEEQEVKIKTKADGTSTIVSTEKFPAQSLLDDPMGLEGTGTGDWGLGGDVTIPQLEIDEYNRRNDLYAMAGQGDIGEIWPTTAPPLTFSPSQGPLVDIPGVTSRLGTPVTEVMGLLEPDVPPPDLQVMEPQPQTAFINRAISEVDRGTANILPPSHLTMGDMPPTLPNWFTGMGEAEVPFAPPQAIAPEQGPLGPPGQYSVGPPAITQGEREAELAAALGEGGARHGQALPMQGLLTDEEILAGGLPPVEGAYDPRDDFDAMAGGVPEVSDFNPFTGIEPEPSVETDIEESVLETAPKKWLDPDTGLIPIERGMLRDVPPLMEETPTQRRERLAAPVEEASIWGGDPALSGVRALRASYQEKQDKLVDESTERYEALMGRAEKAIKKAEETTEQTKKVIDFQRLEWFARLNQQLTEKRRRQGSQVRVGRARSRQQIPMLNPTPLRSA